MEVICGAEEWFQYAAENFQKKEKRMKKGVDKRGSICYYNQALARAATPETK